MTRAELDARGIGAPDVVLVTGDAYVDHPSFAMAILGRWLESLGYSVAILAQPDWKSVEPWRALGRPRLFYGVSAGNMDSMINHYTASRKPRSDDAYSPGGRPGLRPDRPTPVYCQRCREAFPGVPVIAGGWKPRCAGSRTTTTGPTWCGRRCSCPASATCSCTAWASAPSARSPTGSPPARTSRACAISGAWPICWARARRRRPTPSSCRATRMSPRARPTACASSPEATRTIHRETNPLNARRLTQRHGDRVVVVNPPAMPLDEREMDAVYGLPYLRTPHPSYTEAIPADAMIRDSVTIMRGCFGGCTFCSITTHQGRIISSRSEASVLREVNALAASPTFKGTVSDLGGPTANMYQMRCTKPEVEQICRRLSCVHPKVCKLLGTDHGPVIDLMQKSRAVKGVARVNIASGIRMDLARLDPRYVRELAAHHVGGHLKVAPEHTDPTTLELMKKPGVEDFDVFARQFKAASAAAGKPKQYLVPYFIASHPGSTVEAMIDLALYLKRSGYRPRQVQDFIPAPMDIATCMYYTGLDPDDHAARGGRARDHRPEDAAGAAPVLQAGELLRDAPGAAQRGPRRPDRRRLRRPHPRDPAARGHRGADGRRAQVRPDGARRRPRPGRLPPRAPGAEGGRLSPRPPDLPPPARKRTTADGSRRDGGGPTVGSSG